MQDNLETINNLREQLISAFAEIKRLKSASMECPSCQADLSYEPTALEDAERKVAQQSIEHLINETIGFVQYY